MSLASRKNFSAGYSFVYPYPPIIWTASFPHLTQTSEAKYFASEVSVKCGNEAVQIMGGYGYTKEYPAEKFLRDAKLMTIGEGTSEIQKLVISREILK